jgi:hypothetical protein
MKSHLKCQPKNVMIALHKYQKWREQVKLITTESFGHLSLACVAWLSEGVGGDWGLRTSNGKGEEGKACNMPLEFRAPALKNQTSHLIRMNQSETFLEIDNCQNKNVHV